MKSVTTNRPLRELVAEAKAEVMDEIEDDREEGEEDDPMELTAVTDLHSFHFPPRRFLPRTRLTQAQHTQLQLRNNHLLFDQF